MSLRVCHWTMYNNSGMNNVALTMCAAERAIGLDSHIANPFEASHDDLIAKFADFDIHVAHTYFPEWFKRALTKKDWKLVWLGHGTPEYIFHDSYYQDSNKHGINDGMMLQQYYLAHSDAIVTHWTRHAAIYRTMVDRKTPVHVVPMGIDTNFWQRVPSLGKFAGEPSLLWAENTHIIKLPYDLLVAWPWVYPAVKGNALLHVTRLSLDLHRWIFPLVNRNGASYACHISTSMWDNIGLRNTFSSVDYQIGLVWKGDFNRTTLEAASCGALIISYAGNPYADFWLPEGDQRVIAERLVKILNKEIEPRKEKAPILDAKITADMMKKIYETC